ncbi:MAG: D-amino acid dehydrogenase [Gammaproteobacteria bacterium]
MHVVVLGAGVAGVTTAYYLSRLGHHVTLVDRATQVASGASFANAGQLSYSYTDALAKPGFLRELPRLLINRDPGVRIRPFANPRLWPWAWRFVRQCTRRQARDNSRTMLHIAQRSAQRLQQLRDDTNIEFSFRRAGKLVLLRTPEQVEEARGTVEAKRREGCDVALVERDKALGIEPALSDLAQTFAGAIHASDDEVGDAASFCTSLSAWLESNTATEFALGQSVQRVESKSEGSVIVHTDHKHFDAQAVVVCLGAASPALLKPLGLRLPIFPVRGYSVTLPPGTAAPRVSVTDARRRIVFSRLNGHVRIAGFADFLADGANNDAGRVRTLLSVARATAPHAADYDVEDPRAWAGNRPMTPGGPPLVGATPIKGLFLNTGHGMLGWTMACASAHDAAQAVNTFG